MFTSIFNSVMNEPSIAPYVAQVKDYAASLGIGLYIGLIALCLIVGLFGRRLSGLVRVTLLFAVGFVASVHWICPILTPILPQVPGYAVGLTVGLLAAVLSKLIYNGVYIGVIGFDCYNICFNALFFAQLATITKGNLTLSLGVAAVAVILALIIRKYLEMLITAAAGGIGIAFFANQLYNYVALTGMDKNTVIIVAGAILALPMFFWQYRHRIIF